MKAAEVDELFSKYLANVSRRDFLEARIVALRREYDAAKEESVHDLISVTGTLSDMPHGTDVSDPTGRAGIKLADGYKTEEMVVAEAMQKRCEAELNIVNNEIDYVDALLKCLNGKEQIVVRCKSIDKLFWRETAIQVRRNFGDNYSTTGLKKIFKEAMDKIYAVAEE